MIGSILFYALYPLSRYLIGHRAGASKRGLPPAEVNGRTVWDGGTSKTEKFIQSQTTLLDQGLSPSTATEGETKERMKEQNPEEVNAIMNTDQLVAVLLEETEIEAMKMGDVQHHQVEVEDVLMELLRKQTTEGVSQKQAVVLQLKSQQTEDRRQEMSSPVQEQMQMQSVEGCVTPAEDSSQETSCSAVLQTQIQSLGESVTPAEDSIQETTCLVQSRMQIPSIEESVNLSETVGEISECWDEYLSPSVDVRHSGESNLVFTSLLSNTESYLKFTSEHDAQSGWHFPPGPGLAEEVQCPLWQFPTLSYYPPVEPTMPFEVMWRVWEEVDESATAAESTLIPFPLTEASMDFTVMSYNILAQDLLEANHELYIHCPLEVLDWHYRCNLLLGEILKWTPDILCLQEVQENHYHEQLYPVLSQMGYTCVYKRRTGTKTDGCATCYRKSSFTEVSVTPLEYFRPETELLDRHNVGIVLLLRPAVTQGYEVKGPLLCVANTHLLFNPRRGDVKLAQLAIMLAEIDRMVKSCKAEGERCNVVLCGDFNSVPQMPLYQLITTGELYYHGLPAWMISGQEDLSYKTNCHRLFAPLWPSCLEITDNCQYTPVNSMSESNIQKSGNRQYNHEFMLQLHYCPAALVRPVNLILIPGVTDNIPDASRGNKPHKERFRHNISHCLDLESVYKHTFPASGNAEVTTLHSEVGATVDYIFYSPRRFLNSDQKVGENFVSEGLKLIGSLSLLSEDVLWSMKGLPNHIFPSDHLSLVAKFQMNLHVA